jgi:flagellin
MSSIITNNSAMTALQTLRGISKSMNETQTAVSTGKNVSTAKQNAAVWSVAAVMESDVAGYKGVSDAISLASSTIGVARSGAETVVKLMDQMRERINLAQSDNVDKAKIQIDVAELASQIQSTINGSQFNGLNLLTTQADTDFLSGFDRTDATTVTTTNITVVDQGTDIDTAVQAILAWNVDDDNGGDAATALSEFEDNMQIFVDAAAALGSYQKRFELQGDFIKSISDTLKTGIGSLVDADMEETSARLQALQVQQQLGTQSLSIANQAPQSLLSLFR